MSTISDSPPVIWVRRNPIDTVLLTSFLIALFWLPDIAIGTTAFPISRLVLILLLLNVMGKAAVTQAPLIPHTAHHVLLSCGILGFYILIVDLGQNSPWQGIEDWVKLLLLLALVPVFYIMRVNPQRLVRLILVVSTVPMAVATLQIFYPDYTVHALLTLIPGVVSNMDVEDVEIFLRSTGRLVGTNNNAVPFALFLGSCWIIAFIHLRGWVRLTYMAWALVLLYFTYTRSAVWGLIIPLAPATYRNLPMAWHRNKRLLTVGLIICMILATVILVPGGSATEQNRLFNAADPNTIGKLASAYTAVIYAVRYHVFFGVPRDELYLSVYRVYGDLPDALAVYSIDGATTDHNQFAWYLRFYGFIGLALIAMVHFTVWRTIRRLPANTARTALICLFLYITQYSILHNNFLLNDFLFWILFASALSCSALATTMKPMRETIQTITTDL